MILFFKMLIRFEDSDLCACVPCDLLPLIIWYYLELDLHQVSSHMKCNPQVILRATPKYYVLILNNLLPSSPS